MEGKAGVEIQVGRTMRWAWKDEPTQDVDTDLHSNPASTAHDLGNSDSRTLKVQSPHL